jgi:hypothetical protein
MSFIDSATELLDRTEASLNSLMADALKARAYREIAAIAALAEQVSVIGPGRGAGRRPGAQPEMATAGAAAGAAPAEAGKGAEPFWMRPKA